MISNSLGVSQILKKSFTLDWEYRSVGWEYRSEGGCILNIRECQGPSVVMFIILYLQNATSFLHLLSSYCSQKLQTMWRLRKGLHCNPKGEMISLWEWSKTKQKCFPQWAKQGAAESKRSYLPTKTRVTGTDMCLVTETHIISLRLRYHEPSLS